MKFTSETVKEPEKMLDNKKKGNKISVSINYYQNPRKKQTKIFQLIACFHKKVKHRF